MRRLNWTLEEPALRDAIAALRPYRGGPASEALPRLFERLQKQIGNTALAEVEEDEEEADEATAAPAKPKRKTKGATP